MKLIRITAFSLLLVSLTGKIYAQEKKINYSKDPVWIKMMDDTAANYFEVVKAYDTFWKDRVKPETEEELIGEHYSASDKKASRRVEKQKEESEKYSFACKKYEHWLIITKPFVQEDGHILTPHERIVQWRSGK